MKRTKLIANLCLLVLTIACLTFGVYSAVSTKFTASGTITFNAYNLDIDVMCTITGITGGTKTFYGTTFLSNTNSVSATRTDYVADGKIRTDATHFDLSSNGSVMQLGNLVFDEISNDNVEISIEFSFTNYSTFMVKAQGLAKIDATTKLDCQYGGATIMNQYATDGTNSGKFTIKISPKENASATTSADNGLSISINVSPNGLSKIGNNVCDTSVCSKTLYQMLCVDKYNGSTYNELLIDNGDDSSVFEKDSCCDGFVYDISSTNVVAKSSTSVDLYGMDDFLGNGGMYLTPLYKENLVVAETIFGKQVDSISNDEVNDGVVNNVNNCPIRSMLLFKNIYLPNGMTKISAGAFGGYTINNYIYIPDSVITIGEFAFAGCSLNSIKFPKNLTQISSSLFSEGSVGYIEFGDKIQRICEYAFMFNSTKVQNDGFTVPKSVNVIEPCALLLSTSFKTLKFEDPNNWQVSDSENGTYTPISGLTSEMTENNLNIYSNNDNKWWKRVSA